MPRTADGDPLPTGYTFTGQKVDASVGLMYYGARYYDASIGRFIQPDSIVPNPYNPQSLNRYSYVLNNPLKYTDPTGNRECDAFNPCTPEDMSEYEEMKGEVIGDLSRYDVHASSDFSLRQLMVIRTAVGDITSALGGIDAVRKAIGGAHFVLSIDTMFDASGKLCTCQWRDTIYVTKGTFSQAYLRTVLGPQIAIAHELGHYWDWKGASPVLE